MRQTVLFLKHSFWCEVGLGLSLILCRKTAISSFSFGAVLFVSRRFRSIGSNRRSSLDFFGGLAYTVCRSQLGTSCRGSIPRGRVPMLGFFAFHKSSVARFPVSPFEHSRKPPFFEDKGRFLSFGVRRYGKRRLRSQLSCPFIY